MPQVVRQLPWDMALEVEKDFVMPYNLVRLQWPTATYFVSSGPRTILENRLIRSEALATTTPWVRVNISTVTAGAAKAPDGANTAALLVANLTNTSHYLDYSLTGLGDNEVFSAGIFVKKRDYDRARLNVVVKNGSGPTVEIRFSTKTLTVTSQGTGNTGVQFDLRELHDGWFLIRMRNISTLTGATVPRFRPMLCDDAGFGFAGDGTKGTYYWGAHFYAGSEKQPYVATSDAAYAREDYIEGAVETQGFGWDANAGQQGQIELLNENDSAMALVLNRGVDGVQATVWQGYYDAAISEACGPLILASGELTDSDITPTSAIVTVATTKLDVEYIPNRYHTRAEGFNWLPPDDAQVTWGKEIYIFERD